eukprot:2769672-Pleurochrysis_carterae.AAC.3
MNPFTAHAHWQSSLHSRAHIRPVCAVTARKRRAHSAPQGRSRRDCEAQSAEVTSSCDTRQKCRHARNHKTMRESLRIPSALFPCTFVRSFRALSCVASHPLQKHQHQAILPSPKPLAPLAPLCEQSQPARFSSFLLPKTPQAQAG